jgi:hypothetical protein
MAIIFDLITIIYAGGIGYALKASEVLWGCDD